MWAMIRMVYLVLALVFLAGLPGLVNPRGCDLLALPAVSVSPCAEETAVTPAVSAARTTACGCTLIYLPPNSLPTAVTFSAPLFLETALEWETAVTTPPTPPPRRTAITSS